MLLLNIFYYAIPPGGPLSFWGMLSPPPPPLYGTLANETKGLVWGYLFIFKLDWVPDNLTKSNHAECCYLGVRWGSLNFKKCIEEGDASKMQSCFLKLVVPISHITARYLNELVSWWEPTSVWEPELNDVCWKSTLQKRIMCIVTCSGDVHCLQQFWQLGRAGCAWSWILFVAIMKKLRHSWQCNFVGVQSVLTNVVKTLRVSPSTSLLNTWFLSGKLKASLSNVHMGRCPWSMWVKTWSFTPTAF